MMIQREPAIGRSIATMGDREPGFGWSISMMAEWKPGIARPMATTGKRKPRPEFVDPNVDWTQRAPRSLDRGPAGRLRSPAMETPMSDQSCYPENEEFRNDLMAMGASPRLSAPLDPLGAGMMVIGVLPAIRSYRAELHAVFGPERTACIDRLEPLANAMLRLHAECSIIPPTKNLEPITAELSRLRAWLTSEAKSLVARGLLDRRRLSEVSGRIGRTVIVADVLLLVSILHDHLPDLASASAVTLEVLGRAETLADELSHELSDSRSPEHLAAVDLRQRALCLLVETYEEVRSLITYLRWKDGDADVIAPSLWRTRAQPRAKRRA